MNSCPVPGVCTCPAQLMMVSCCVFDTILQTHPTQTKLTYSGCVQPKPSRGAGSSEMAPKKDWEATGDPSECVKCGGWCSLPSLG